jgi:DNA-binding CsgD family transcriptional regulator
MFDKIAKVIKLNIKGKLRHLFKDQMVFVLFLFILIVLTVLDIKEDFQEGISMRHIDHEIGLVLLYLFGMFALVWNQWSKNKKFKKLLGKSALKNKETYKQLQKSKIKLNDILLGVSHKVDQELESWKLTSAEKEVAFLLLKGLSVREISEMRETSEKTVGQQCQQIYKKSGISGRIELLAYFLEDYLVPIQIQMRATS